MTNLLPSLFTYSTFLRRKLCIKNKHVSKHQGFQNTLGAYSNIFQHFNKETRKPLLNIRIILFSNKIQILKNNNL